MNKGQCKENGAERKSEGKERNCSKRTAEKKGENKRTNEGKSP